MSAPLLIADDSEGKIMMLKTILHMRRWQGDIFVATSTEQAIALITQHPDIGFGLIDFYIPSANGPAIIRALKAKNPSARVALVSSSDNAKNTAAAMEAGAEHVICTGMQADVLEKAMTELLEDWMEK